MSRPKLVLPALLLLSGFCGISYEILYAKLLGNLLGNQFTITAGVLLTFLFGIGLGTLHAHRFVRHLWLVEAGIGLYAAAIVGSYLWIDRLLYGWVPALGTSVVACALVSVVLLALPAFLVGCSVPLFAAYLGTLRSRSVFAVTYGIYNLGAALTALGMEFVVLRTVGLRAATVGLASLNLVVAAGLLWLMRRTPLVPSAVAERARFPARDLAALATASVASAVFQLLAIKISECILGPFNETFSLVLATVLLGLTLGAWAVSRTGLGFEGALVAAGAGLVFLLASVPWVVRAYAAAYPVAVTYYPALVLLKFLLVLGLAGLPAVGFGATIPALLRTHRDIARESGQLLFVSSMANVAGFLLMAFVLHRYLDYGPILLVVTTLTALALALRSGGRRWWGAVAIVLLALLTERTLWRESLLYLGHENFHSTAKLRRVEARRFSAEKFRGHQDVFAITRIDGEPYFFINGYVSIPLASAAEKIVGALSAMLSPRTDDALVLGVGSGATAATVGLVFDRTDAVEINPAVVDNLHRMSRYNFDITDRANVNIVHDDGIHFVKTATKRYSLILNTVTTPLYFSSSKLYTLDFLEQVTSRLTPDGTYTTWVDNSIGDNGVDIILQTLDAAFEQCWLAYLRSGYYLVACSNQPLAPRQLQAVLGNDELRRYMAERHGLSVDLLAYSILAADALQFRSRSNAPVNTLDFPVLEHEMARLRSLTGLGKFRHRLIDRLALRELAEVMEGYLAWDPAAFAFFADMVLDRESGLATGLREIEVRQFGDIGPGYRRVALAHAEQIGTSRAFRLAGNQLRRRQLGEAAVEAYARAAELDPRSVRARYELGRTLEELGRFEQARQAYAAVLELDPEHADAGEGLRRVASQGVDLRETGGAGPR